MATFSTWHWVTLALIFFFVLWPTWRIVGKTGLHPALSLLFLVPFVNCLFFLYLAFVPWPVEKRP